MLRPRLALRQGEEAKELTRFLLLTEKSSPGIPSCPRTLQLP